MLIGSVVGFRLSRLLRGIGRIGRRIDRCVNSGGEAIAQHGVDQDTANITQLVMDQKTGELDVQESANVAKTAKKKIGTIIDIRV